MPSIALLDGPDRSPDTQAHQTDVTWEGLTAALRDVLYTPCLPCKGKDCEHKAGRAWLPVRLVADVCKRLDINVAAITFAVFDLDDPRPEQMQALGVKLQGHQYFIHQTHRGNGYRVVLPLAEEIPKAMWREVQPRIAEKFGLPWDTTCINESRLYYCPTRPQGQSFSTYDGAGEPLNWKALDPVFPGGAESAIANYKRAVVVDGKTMLDPTDPKNLRDGPMDLEELRRAVTAMRRPESRAMLDTILAGRRLTENEPVDVGARDNTINKAVSVLASAPLGKPYPAETIVALLTGSIRAMTTEPEGLDYWLDEARKKYLRAAGRRLEHDANRDEDKAAILRVLGQEPGKVTEGSDDEWRRGLIYTLTTNGEPGGLRPIGANANLIFHHDPAWKDTLRFNEITREIDVLSGPLMGKNKASLDTEAANWLARSDYRLFLGSREVGEQMLALAREHSYDPLRQMLEAVSWDGTPRVRRFLGEYLGADGPADHVERISECFLVSCIARAMDPGCEVHTVPILIGPQGAGKSRALKALGQPYFTDSGLNIGDKDSKLLIASKWIVELAELASVRNVDIEKVKNFVTIAVDPVRPPYGRVTEDFPRRCVFVGTTNEEEILTDWTGNRRWWPLKLKAAFKIDVERVRADRDQLFAEALVMYRNGVKHWLTDEEAARAEEQAGAFKKGSVRSEQILAWFAAKPPSERPRELTTFDVLNTVLGVPSSQVSHAQAVDVGRAVRELGFIKHRKRQGGQLMWIYEVPEAITLMPVNAKPSNLELVIQAKPQSESK